jgi:hypothetical protein
MFDQCLRAVAVVHVPIHDEHALDTATLFRVMSGNSHVAEQAEPHRAIAQGVMSRRSHGAERTRLVIDGHVHRVQDATHGGASSIPRTFAQHRVHFGRTTAGLGHFPDLGDVTRIVREHEVCVCRMTTLDVFEGVKELGVFA